MVNYSNAKIYKLVSDSEPNKVYIGSTTQRLSKRLGGHVTNYKRFLNGKHHYISSYELLKNNDYQILLIENVSCENKEELHKKEGEWIRKYKNDNELEECINTVIPCRTLKEYREDNKDKISKQRKLFYENNKDRLLNDKKEYSKKNKDKIKERKGIKANCEYCNKLLTKYGMSRHYKTIKCKSKQLELNITI